MNRFNHRYITVTFQDFITIYQVIYNELFYGGSENTGNNLVNEKVSCEPIEGVYKDYLDVEIGKLLKKEKITLKGYGYHYIPNSGFNVKVNIYPCDGAKKLDNYVYVLNPGVFRERGGDDYIFMDIILPPFFKHSEIGKEEKDDIALFAILLYQLFCNLLDSNNAFYMMILMIRIGFKDGLDRLFESRHFYIIEQFAPYPYSVYSAMGSAYDSTEDFDENKKVFLSEMKHYTDFCTSSEGLIDIFTGKRNDVDITDRNIVLKYLQDIGIGN